MTIKKGDVHAIMRFFVGMEHGEIIANCEFRIANLEKHRAGEKRRGETGFRGQATEVTRLRCHL